MRVASPLVFLVALCGCEEDIPPLEASAFNQACTENSDCLGVLEGDLCCPQDPAAISADAIDAYNSAVDDPRCEAAPEDSCLRVPEVLRPACVDNECQIVQDSEACPEGSFPCPGVD